MNEKVLKIDLKTRLVVNQNLVLRIEDDYNAILFDPDSGRVHILNETAVKIWQRLDGRRCMQDVLDSLCVIYDGMDETAEKQVLDLAESLAHIGAVGVMK